MIRMIQNNKITKSWSVAEYTSKSIFESKVACAVNAVSPPPTKRLQLTHTFSSFVSAPVSGILTCPTGFY